MAYLKDLFATEPDELSPMLLKLMREMDSPSRPAPTGRVVYGPKPTEEDLRRALLAANPARAAGAGTPPLPDASSLSYTDEMPPGEEAAREPANVKDTLQTLLGAQKEAAKDTGVSLKGTVPKVSANQQQNVTRSISKAILMPPEDVLGGISVLRGLPEYQRYSQAGDEQSKLLESYRAHLLGQPVDTDLTALAGLAKAWGGGASYQKPDTLQDRIGVIDKLQEGDFGRRQKLYNDLLEGLSRQKSGSETVVDAVKTGAEAGFAPPGGSGSRPNYLPIVAAYNKETADARADINGAKRLMNATSDLGGKNWIANVTSIKASIKALESGRLTAEDYNLVASTPEVLQRLKDTWEEMKSGNLTEEKIGAYQEAATMMAKAAELKRQDIQKRYENAAAANGLSPNIFSTIVQPGANEKFVPPKPKAPPPKPHDPIGDAVAEAIREAVAAKKKAQNGK